MGHLVGIFNFDQEAAAPAEALGDRISEGRELSEEGIGAREGAGHGLLAWDARITAST